MKAVVLRGRCAAPQDEGFYYSLMLRRFAKQSLEASVTQKLEIK